MFGAKKVSEPQTSLYATKQDFCRIFQKNMEGLYLLSLLLTGNEAMAEECFVGGLKIAHGGTRVFKDWAESWARRTIILNAIRMARPRLTFDRTTGVSGRSTMGAPPEISAILELPAFERFSFVMSVLEGYSDQECALHLGCTRGDLIAARSRALERITWSAEVRKKVVSVASLAKAAGKTSLAELQLETVSGLAAPV